MKKKLANVNVKKKPYLVDFASENAQYAQLIRYITNNGKKKKTIYTEVNIRTIN